MTGGKANTPRRPTILIIMDGIGHNPSTKHNAVALANTPNLDELYSKHSLTVIEASGKPVGLPDGQMGNSEVGHSTIGSGQIIRQDLVGINDAVTDKSFFKKQNLTALMQRCADADRPLNIVGLVSDGGIHSHIDHLLAMIQLSKQFCVKPLLHMFTDGRDTAPRCSDKYLKEIEPALESAGGAIVTITGRYYAMDRDNRWDRVEIAFQGIVNGVGAKAEAAREGIEAAWAKGEDDEFITPIILPEYQKPQAGDEFVFFNFRNDRPRQISKALSVEDFDGFDRGAQYQPFPLTTLTNYGSSFDFPVVFEKEVPLVTLGEIISDAGIKQFHSAETEKYPHVTFFFNGGREEPYPGEDRKVIASPKVATYDLQPEMSAYEVADVVTEAIHRGEYGFIVVNFANGDMVGHTGVREAVIKAVETVDEVVQQVVDAACENGFSVIITADHGNADMLVDPVTGGKHTQHTTFPVACLVIDEVPWKLVTGLGLSALAPTVLQLMGLDQPKQMTGQSLLLEVL